MTTSYRLIVRVGGKQQSSGTAWYVAPDLVATAFHVVGNCGQAKWIHQDFDGVSYHLEGAPEIRLKARSFDPQVDVAVLRSEVACEEWLPLANVVPRGERWLAEGYPGFHAFKLYTLSGTVTQVYEQASGRAVQLLVKQGTDVDWSGISGSAIVVGGRAVALLTEVTRDTNTAWGAAATAVERLVNAVGIGDELLRLLLTVCNESDAARWQAQISEAPERDLVSLLDSLGEEYPEAIELRQLTEKARNLARKVPKSAIPVTTLLELGDRYLIVREEDAGRRPKPTPRREFRKVFERNQGFGGRATELARLERFITVQPGGYFFVTGLPGFGKTSLLARWIESLTARGLNTIFYFLTPEVAEKLEARTTFKSLCEQLMSFHRLGGELSLPWSKLQECYAELLQLPPAKGLPLVVVLDGLDEALPLWTPSAEMFPKDLPSGVHVVFSARSMAKNWLQDLGLELNDSRILQLGQLNRDELQEALTHSKLTATPKLTDQVFTITDGDPFYVTDVVRHLRRNHDDPASLQTLPKGHSAYLQNWWDTAVESVTRPGFEDLMGTAALLHAPLPSKDLVLISDEDELRGSDIRVLLKQAARYIEGDEENGYGLHHQRIKQFVQDKLVDRIAVFRKRLANFCIRWSNPQLSTHGRDYVLRYAVVHLEAANQHNQAAGLMTAEWLAAQWKHFSSYRSVIADLERLVRAAAGRTGYQEAVCTAPALALAKEDARDIMQQLPVPILRAWVRLGRVEQAIEFLDSLLDYRAEAREHLLGVAEELCMVAAERNDMLLQRLAKPLLERVIGRLTLVRSPMWALEALDSTVEVLCKYGLDDSGMRALAAQATAFAESREQSLLRAAALACAARLTAKFSQAEARRLLGEAEETARELKSSPDLLLFWSFALPVVRILEPNRVRGTVESNLRSLHRPPGESPLSKDPLSSFLSRWNPTEYGEADWAAPLVNRLAGLYTGVKEGPASPMVFQLLGEFGQADLALDLLDNLSLQNSPEIVKRLAPFRRETVAARLDRLRTNPRIHPTELAPGFAAVGNWDTVFKQLQGAPSHEATTQAFLGCAEIAAQLPEAKDWRACLDALVKGASIFKPEERKRIEAAVGLAFLRRGPVELNDHLRSAIRHSLADRPGDLDTLLVLMAVAYAQEGRFSESDAMAKRCRWLHIRVVAYKETIRVALKDHPEAVHWLVEGIMESSVSLPAETFLDFALLYTCDAADLLVAKLPNEATRLATFIEGWMEWGRPGLLHNAMVRIQVRLARIRTALDASQGPNQGRALLKKFEEGLETSQPCSELFDFLVSVDASEARETLEGGRRLYEGFKARQDQIAARADYAAALAKIDPVAAAALLEDTIHELTVLDRNREFHTSTAITLIKQLYGDHPSSDTVVETLSRIVAAIARTSRNLGPGFVPVLRQAYAVALEAEEESVREAGIFEFFRKGATTPADREQDLCSVLAGCVDELPGKLTTPRRNWVLLEGVSALGKADLQRAALVLLQGVTDPAQRAEGDQFLHQRLADVKRRRDLSGLSPLEEYFVNQDKTDASVDTLWHVQEEGIDSWFNQIILSLAERLPSHHVRGVVIPHFLPLVYRKWGIDAARSLVDSLADFDQRWAAAADIVARQD